MKTKTNDFIQEPYKTGYKEAANGKWEYEEYWNMSHIERRKAATQIKRSTFAIHEI